MRQRSTALKYRTIRTEASGNGTCEVVGGEDNRAKKTGPKIPTIQGVAKDSISIKSAKMDVSSYDISPNSDTISGNQRVEVMQMSLYQVLTKLQ
jgi:hypothetical protein